MIGIEKITINFFSFNIILTKLKLAAMRGALLSEIMLVHRYNTKTLIFYIYLHAMQKN